jgi:hypothetical protein
MIYLSLHFFMLLISQDVICYIMEFVRNLRGFEALSMTCKATRSWFLKHGLKHVFKLAPPRLMPFCTTINDVHRVLKVAKGLCELCDSKRVKSVDVDWNVFAHKKCIRSQLINAYYVQHYVPGCDVKKHLPYVVLSGYNPDAYYNTWSAAYYWLSPVKHVIPQEKTVEGLVWKITNKTTTQINEERYKKEEEERKVFLAARRTQKLKLQQRREKRDRTYQERLKKLQDFLPPSWAVEHPLVKLFIGDFLSWGVMVPKSKWKHFSTSLETYFLSVGASECTEVMSQKHKMHEELKNHFLPARKRHRSGNSQNTFKKPRFR